MSATIISDPRAQYAARLQPVKVCTQEEFGDWQIEQLVSSGLAKCRDFDKLRNRVPKLGLFLFVPPPPTNSIDYRLLMAKVVVKGLTGTSYLISTMLTDLVENPTKPSLLVDVEDGRERLNLKPMDSRKNIKREGRVPYTTWRGFVHLLLFPEVLEHHYLDLVGSRYSRENVPILHLGVDEPTLNDCWEGSARANWGAPSCERVIVS